MKTFFFLIAVFTCSSISLSAQTTKLSDVASILFKNVKTKLTIAEQNQIALKLGFILSADKDQPFAADKDSKDFPFAAFVMPTDINKDGKEEIFVSFGNTYTSGNTGSSVSLFIKSADGSYALNLGFPGTIPDALTTFSKGYPDLLIGGAGMQLPVWRWNGKEYVYYKSINDSEYEKLKTTSIEEISKTYQQTISN